MYYIHNILDFFIKVYIYIYIYTYIYMHIHIFIHNINIIFINLCNHVYVPTCLSPPWPCCNFCEI